MRKSKNKKYNKNKKGGEKGVVAKNGEKCPAHKPICVNKTLKHQNKVCGSEEGKFSPKDTLQHAFQVFSDKGKTVDTLDCPTGSTSKECFCTNFDYVWLESIQYAQEKIEEDNKKISSLPTMEDAQELKDSADKVPTEPDNFFGTFFDQVITIAEGKWAGTGTLGEKSTLLIEKMKQIKEMLEKIFNDPEAQAGYEKFNSAVEKIKENSPEETLEVLKKAQSNSKTTANLQLFNHIIQRFFTLGKFILYDGNQIETLDKEILKNDLDALLNDLGLGEGDEAEGEEPAGGRKTLRRKDKKSKKGKRFNKTRKFVNKRGGGKKKRALVFALTNYITGIPYSCWYFFLSKNDQTYFDELNKEEETKRNNTGKRATSNRSNSGKSGIKSGESGIGSDVSGIERQRDNNSANDTSSWEKEQEALRKKEEEWERKEAIRDEEERIRKLKREAYRASAAGIAEREEERRVYAEKAAARDVEEAAKRAAMLAKETSKQRKKREEQEAREEREAARYRGREGNPHY